MFRRLFCLVPILLIGILSATGPARPQTVESAQKPAKASTPDFQKLADAVNGSFYHPDQLPGLQCTVVIDWSTSINSAGAKVPQERIHTLDGVQIQARAIRNKAPELQFRWFNGVLDTKDQFELGIRGFIANFYQGYWSTMASPPIPNVSEISKVEPQPDGTTKIYLSDSSDPNKKSVMTVNRRNAPTHYALDAPMFKGTIDVDYADSPAHVTGDLRRISSYHVIANMGASSFNASEAFDYQVVEGYSVPNHVTFNLIGVNTVPMEFLNCSSISAAADAPPNP